METVCISCICYLYIQYIYTCICICMCACPISVSTNVYIHIYIYIYTHVSVYLYVYTRYILEFIMQRTLTALKRPGLVPQSSRPLRTQGSAGCSKASCETGSKRLTIDGSCRVRIEGLLVRVETPLKGLHRDYAGVLTEGLLGFR